MLFEGFETEILTKLATDLGSGIEVEIEPDKESENAVPYQKPRVSILFDHSDYAKTKGLGSQAQEETLTMALVIRSRQLRGANGTYAVADKIRQSLLGFEPTNYEQIWIGKFTFIKKEKGLWEHAVMITSRTLIVSEIEVNTGPALTQTNTVVTT